MSPSFKEHLEQLSDRHGAPDARDTTVPGTTETDTETEAETEGASRDTAGAETETETAGAETEGAETETETDEERAAREADPDKGKRTKPRRTSQTQRRINQLVQDRQHALDDRENALQREQAALEREGAAIRENATLRERMSNGGGGAANGAAGAGAPAAPAPDLPQWDPEKYADQDEWLRAVAAASTAHATAQANTIVEKRLQRFQEEQGTRDEQTRTAQQDEEAAREFDGRLGTARQRYADFDEVVGANAIPISRNLQMAFRNLEAGPDLMYYLAQHPDECEKVSRMRQMSSVLVRLGELQVGLRGARQATAPRGGRTTRTAAEPGTLLGGRRSTTPERDYSNMDLATYQELRRSGQIR